MAVGLNDKEFLSNLPYSEQIAYHKGAFSTLLALKNVVEHTQTSIYKKLIPKKVYKLLYSYLNECLHNVDEMLIYGGLLNVIIDKDNNCKRVSDEEAEAFREKCRKQYEEKNSLSQ